MAKPSTPFSNLLKVNLLHHPEDQLQLHMRILRWVLSSGRYIVVIVELIVIGAFVYRYKLDADSVALQEEIQTQSAYVRSLSTIESQLKLLQFQLSSIDKVKSENPNYTQFFVKLASLTPKSIKLNTVVLDKVTVPGKVSLTITGTTPSNIELSAFMKALQKEPTLENITLANIAYDGSTTFTITGGLKLTDGTVKKS
jgi:Tfp pilus assembly protein PilN